MNSPAITVLMPFHNAALHLDEAVDSILAQSWTDFELLAVDDGSGDGGSKKLADRNDARIRIERLPQNLGVVGALNHGLVLARGDFIARMDADDIAEPTRLARQLAVLEARPEIGVLGTDFAPFGENPCESWIRHHEDVDLRIALLFENPLCHPTVMMRRCVLENVLMRFPGGHPHAEEYALWLELSRHTRFANIPEKLLRYRSHADQVSRRHGEEQCNSIDRLVRRQLNDLGLTAREREMRLHHLFGSGFFPMPGLDQAVEKWMQTLLAANSRMKVYPEQPFADQLARRRDAALVRHKRILGSMRTDQRLRWRFSSWLKS